MSRLHIADTGLFVAMGQSSNSRYQAVGRFARRNDLAFIPPERVYEELTVDETAYDDIVAPTELQISLSDGLGDAESVRLDIQWCELGMYSFHYVDSDDVNWRFDRHPNTHSPEIHFHPPPEAARTAAEPSCIDVTEVSLVTRAVHAMWRAAYENDELNRQNSASNPS